MRFSRKSLRSNSRGLRLFRPLLAPRHGCAQLPLQAIVSSMPAVTRPTRPRLLCSTAARVQIDPRKMCHSPEEAVARKTLLAETEVLPTYFSFWGKVSPEVRQVEPATHSIAYHSLDVAAVAQVLLLHNPRKLQAIARLLATSPDNARRAQSSCSLRSRLSRAIRAYLTAAFS